MELWQLFTAEEEYRASLKDRYGRAPYWASKNRTVFTPVISEYLLQNGLRPHYPGNKKFAVCLTHDIDMLYNNISRKQLAKNGAKSLVTLNLQNLSKNLQAGLRKRINPHFHIAETLKIEKKYEAKSSSYFLSLSKEEEDFNYDLSEISEIFDAIAKSNGEVGLHGGHLASNNISKIRQEKEKLEAAIGRSVDGYRSHYLKFNTPSTWEHLETLNFKYDTTYGFADCAGFRNGMCHPFQPYSLEKKAFLNIVELPLVIMDNTLWKYMNLNEAGQFELCKQLIDTVARNNGVLTLLWHNTQMQGHPGLLYDAILKYANEKEAWMTTGNEIVDFWKENKFHEVTKNIFEELKNNRLPV